MIVDYVHVSADLVKVRIQFSQIQALVLFSENWAEIKKRKKRFMLRLANRSDWLVDSQVCRKLELFKGSTKRQDARLNT